MIKWTCKGIFFLSIYSSALLFLFFHAYSISRLNIIASNPAQLHSGAFLPFAKVNHPQPRYSIGITRQPYGPNGSQELLFHELPKSIMISNSTWAKDVRQPQKFTQAVLTAGKNVDEDAFYDRSLFLQDYNQMNATFKIYIYPHSPEDPFANVLLPDLRVDPGGNYASEAYFKVALYRSRFLTDDPTQADLFYLPFSIAGLRNDPRISIAGIPGFIRDYVRNVSHRYPFWNRTGGADHFYVACHSVGRSAIAAAVQVKLNAIQVVCSSSYFLSGYVAHKDVSIPQIWPRKGRPPTRKTSERKKMAFYAGAMNSRVREFLVKAWENDSDVEVHRARLKTPYSEALLDSKFCIHAKGFDEVNTARIGDALYYGCVPVALADYYDLPYADILEWNSFAVVVSTVDIPALKRILEGIGDEEYVRLQRNVMRVQRHFQWHRIPVDFDAFHMVMYELWLRRSHVRIDPFDSLSL